MNGRSTNAPPLDKREAECTGQENRKSALFLASAFAVLCQRRRTTLDGDKHTAHNTGFATLDSPSACRDLLAKLFAVATERIRFDWADTTMRINVVPEPDPVLDSDWFLDSDEVSVRIDWHFTVYGRTDEIVEWLARGLIIVANRGKFTVAPVLLTRIQESVPIWNEVLLALEVIDTSEAPILDRSHLPSQDETRAAVGLATGLQLHT